jgi:O-antigen ligase
MQTTNSQMRNSQEVDRRLPGSPISNASMRPYRWPVLWLALLIILIGVGTWLGLDLHHIQSSYPGLSPTISLAADKSYGVNADLTRYPPAALDHTLTRMKELGLRWIRQPFPWAEIEPTSGQFNWARWDQVVEAVSAHGLQLIAVLDTTPAWARPPNTSPFTPPTELADFGGFARVLADRYGDRIDYYQIWDEPNLSAHWGDRFVDPTAYARLLREGAVNIRAADANAIILTAALAPTVETGPLNLNEPTFLAGLYAINAGPWFDVVAVQPYGFDEEPTAPPNEKSLNLARAELLRQTMVLHADGNKPVWATAFGWSALPQDWRGGPSPWPALSSEQQMTYTTQAIRQARANWFWLGPMFFAAWDAETLPENDPRRGLALVAGETLLPQAQAMHRHVVSGASEPLPGEEIATVGTYPAHHPTGHYTGAWRFSAAGADVPRQPPARLTIPFEGTRLDLRVRRGAFRGFLYVTIDGQPANSLPQQAGRAYIVLYDPLAQEDTVTLARHLSDGPHTAVIEADGGWYQWSVVGWRVSREGDTRTIQLGLILAGGIAIVAVSGLVRSTRRIPLRDVQRAQHWGDRLYTHYLELGTPTHWLLIAGAALAFYFAPRTLPSVGLMGLLFLAILPRPDLGLTLVAFSLPFFLLPKSLAGRTISMTEVSLVLVALACVARRAVILIGAAVRAPRDDARVSRICHRPGWLDWAAWVLTAIAILFGLLTLIPAANRGAPADANWPALALLLLPPAGVLAAAAQADYHINEATSLEGKEQWIQRLVTSPTRNLDLGVVALAGLAFAATLAAENFGVSFQDFHVVVWDGAAFYAFVRLIRSPNTESPAPATTANSLIWHVVDALLLGVTLMAFYAIYQFFFTDQAITAEGVHRALGVYGSPNNLALLLDRAAPVLIAIAIFSPVGGRMRQRRIMYGLALVPTLMALVLTFSRGALLLGLPAAILFIGLMRGGRALWATLGALVVGGVGLLPLFGTERFRSMLDTRAGTGFFRLRLWQSALAMLSDHPWLGVGLDNFLYQYRTRYILPDAWQEPNLSHPHNILLDFGTRLGVGGIAVLLWLQFAFWRAAWHLYHRQPLGEERALILGLMGSMVATLAHGMVDNSFFLVDLAYIFFLTLGVVGKLAASREERIEG